MRPWTKKEIAMLGTATDPDVAARIGRHPKAVESKRLRLGIAPHTPHSFAWTAKQIARLGTMPDADLAKILGCDYQTVFRKRRSLGISPFSESHARAARGLPRRAAA